MWRITVILLACALLGACPTRERQVAESQPNPLELVVTVRPLSLILQEFGSAYYHIEQPTLLQPGQDPHTFEPKPSQVVLAREAELLLWVHPALDGWALDLGGEALQVTSLLPGFEHDSKHEHDEGSGHDRG